MIPNGSGVYYGGMYWNNLPGVAAYINEAATGNPNVSWYEHLLAYHGQPFRRALSLNCGNGWVDRDLVTRGIAQRVVGVDVSEELLALARVGAASAGLEIEYIQADINSFEFDVGEVDLVVNFAAAHHITFIDRVFRQIAHLLGPDGIFVSHDYVGPHRNQYPAGLWEQICRLNDTLPAELRKRLCYPHLPTMIETDPTEAIHSELFGATLCRYFEPQVTMPLGGALAYEVLTFNEALHVAYQNGSEAALDAVKTVLAADRSERELRPDTSLFQYCIATPKREAAEQQTLDRWRLEEAERERAASSSNGKYYPGTLVGDLWERIVDLESRRPPSWRKRLGKAVPPRFRPKASQLLRQVTTRYRAMRLRCSSGPGEKSHHR
jgi:SAM-dependent methyltransferase